MAAEVCVAFTLRDALELGFAGTLIEDATRPIDAEDFRKTKRELLRKGAKIVCSRNIR